MAVAAQTFLPICELSMYQTKWTIKARVTNKAPLRTFSKGTGQGKVFHVELLDAAGGEIRASFFNQAAEKFYDVLEKGKCFTFSKGGIRVANKQYNPCSHNYELSFDKDAQVEAASDDASIEEMKLSFVTLRALQTRAVPCTGDFVGVIVSFKPTQTVNGKDGELVKREITIADDSATSLTVALWGDRAKQADSVFEGHPVVVLKSVLVKEFRESKSGSLLQSGALIFNHTSAEAKRVQQWWSEGGSSQELVQLSELKAGAGSGGKGRNATPTDLGGLRLASERVGATPEFFSVVARLALVQTRKQGEPQPLCYMACQEPKEGNNYPCNKRVDESGFCISCNKTGKVAPRLNIRCRFADYQDNAWLTSFHEGATKILGMTGDEVRALELAAAEKGEAGREELEAKIRKQYFVKPMNITMRAKMGMYNNEARSEVTVVDAQPVSYGDHGRLMLKEMNELLTREAQAGA